MHTGENSDRKSPQQSVRGSRISICHVSAGDAWAGIEVQVSTLLRALSKLPEVSLYAIVLYDGRLAQELRSFGVTVHVVSEQQKSFPRLISGCAQFVKGRNIVKCRIWSGPNMVFLSHIPSLATLSTGSCWLPTISQ
jgi:hypothetical protein